MTDGPGGLGDVVFAPNIEIVPMPEENYQGRQWGYRISLNGEPFLKAWTGGTGPCWNLQPEGTVFGVNGEEEHESVHICDLDEWIAVLTELRDSQAHRENEERWS